MKNLAITLLLSLLSGSVLATDSTDTQCLTNKYNAYIDASLMWYQDLVSITTAEHPDLKEVGDWFLAGRTHHFELNREAVSYYLVNDPSKIDLDKPVESWLKLEQSDIKALSTRNDKLGELAKTTFNDRQSSPNKKNYDLRSAFAELLSHPKNINPALDKYNQAIATTSSIQCQ